MKILVPVKRVVNYNVKFRVKSDGSGVDIANVKMSMNRADEIAKETARSSSRSTKTRKRRSSASPITASSATCSRRAELASTL